MLSWSGGRTTAAAWTVSRLALPPSRFVFAREFSEPSAGPWKGTGAFPGTFGMAAFFSFRPRLQLLCSVLLLLTLREANELLMC